MLCYTHIPCAISIICVQQTVCNRLTLFPLRQGEYAALAAKVFGCSLTTPQRVIYDRECRRQVLKTNVKYGLHYTSGGSQESKH